MPFLLPKTARMRKNQEGSAIVEFALVLPVFLALFFSIIEVGWVFFASGVTDRAASNAERLVRTGQVQRFSDSASEQREFIFGEVCRFAKIFGDCAEKVTVEVVVFSDFEALAADDSEITCRNSSQDAQDNLQFSPGGDNALTRIRICVLYETLNPGIGLVLNSTNGEPDRIITQRLFRTEPFERNIRS